MFYEVSIPEEEPWVNLKILRSITGEESRKAVKEAIELANRHELNRFFVEAISGPMTVNVVDQYQLVHRYLKEYGYDQWSKVAILVKEGDDTRQNLETIFRNAGYNMLLFVNEAEAKEWLRT